MARAAAALPAHRIRDICANCSPTIPNAASASAAEAAGLYLDYSKNRINDETLRLLFELAEACGVRARTEAMFQRRENQCHRAARGIARCVASAAQSKRILVDGRNVVPDVHAVLDRMAAFSRSRPQRRLERPSGKRIRNVVNIGIGGSDLGPVMAYEALRHYSRARHDVSLRLQHRRHRFHRSGARSCSPMKRCSSSARRRSPRWRHLTNARAARQWCLECAG